MGETITIIIRKQVEGWLPVIAPGHDMRLNTSRLQSSTQAAPSRYSPTPLGPVPVLPAETVTAEYLDNNFPFSGTAIWMKILRTVG